MGLTLGGLHNSRRVKFSDHERNFFFAICTVPARERRRGGAATASRCPPPRAETKNLRARPRNRSSIDGRAREQLAASALA